ncbi:MAG: hypothetical protein KDC35_05880 [Acidobacteria bacterium]|nr:hypothetical protein [Acidobacteriota bacterium]
MTYHIADEPKPSGLAHLAVHPLWPLFGVMFAGTWLAWPWFAFNGFAVGSPTKWRELTAVIIGWLCSVVILFAIIFAEHSKLLTSDVGRWVFLITKDIWIITVSYWIFTTQTRTIELFQYTGGKLRNGLFAVVVSYFVSQKIAHVAPAFIVAVFGR